MSDILQLPKELPWLNAVFEECFEVMRALWDEDADQTISIARSNWLFELMDIRKWSHRLSVADLDVRGRFEAQMMAIMILPNHKSSSVREKYSNWLERRVLRKLKEEESDLYNSLLDRASKVIEQVVKQQHDQGVNHE